MAIPFMCSRGYPVGVVVGRVVVLHGVQSHGGWYKALGASLAEAGFEAIFPDRRGSGKNTGNRPGHPNSAKRLVGDLIELLELSRSAGGAGGDRRLSVALAGISWGGKLAGSGRREEAGLG